jgi:lipopolysaccharide/colanic/teichoic acid biosynthesis glycosyltransferase
MGRVRSFPIPAPPSVRHPGRPAPLARVADVVVAGLGLLLAAPLMALLGLLVHVTSHGPVLQRDLVAGTDGRSVELLSFRTVLDGARTQAHERVRAVVGATAEEPLTPVGGVMRTLRLDRLPRLVNIVAGDWSLFG